MNDKLSAKTVKIPLLKNLYAYVTHFLKSSSYSLNLMIEYSRIFQLINFRLKS